MAQRKREQPRPARSGPASERLPGPVGGGRASEQESRSSERLTDLQRIVGESAQVRHGARAQAMAARPPLQRRTAQVVQRRLGYDQAIRANEVTKVKQLGGKLVFRLTGAQGDMVIVKFEGHGGAETTPEATSRNELIQVLTQGVIDNVPGMNRLDAGDVRELQQLPDDLGGDVGLLKRIVGDAHSPDDLIFLKKENVSVGENLRDMILKESQEKAKPVRMKKGGELRDVLPQSQRILLNPEIARAMGRTASFDLLVGSGDRFVPDPGAVNLENIDFSGAGTELVNLDQFDPNAPIQEDREWEGAAILTDPANMERYANTVYHELFSRAGIPEQFFDPAVPAAFSQGMVAAAAKLKSRRGIFVHIAGNPKVEVPEHHRRIAGVLATRLAALP